MREGFESEVPLLLITFQKTFKNVNQLYWLLGVKSFDFRFYG